VPYGAAWLHLLDGNDAMAWVKSRDLPCGLIFIAAGAFGLLFASDLPVGSGARMGPGYFPTLLSWTLIGVGGIVLLRMILGGRVPAAPMQWRPILLVTVSLVLFSLLLERAGLLVAMGVLICVGAAATNESRWREVALLALGLSIFSAAAFVWGLGLPLKVLP